MHMYEVSLKFDQRDHIYIIIWPCSLIGAGKFIKVHACMHGAVRGAYMHGQSLHDDEGEFTIQ